jgi:hypothetical protein
MNALPDEPKRRMTAHTQAPVVDAFRPTIFTNGEPGEAAQDAVLENKSSLQAVKGSGD